MTGDINLAWENTGRNIKVSAEDIWVSVNGHFIHHGLMMDVQSL
jgi:hypothetical protein